MTPDVATAMYYTGLDPFTMKEVHIAKQRRDRKFQRALLQFFKPDNWFTVRDALLEANRQDLIGAGCDCLISATPPPRSDRRPPQASQRSRPLPHRRQSRRRRTAGREGTAELRLPSGSKDRTTARG